jgi:hypothetical protein
MTTLLEKVGEERELREQPQAGPPRRVGPMRIVVSVLVLLALLAGAVALLVTAGGDEEAAEPLVRTQPVDEEEVLRQLVNQGYVPEEAFDAEAYWTEWAQAHGYVPSEAFEPPLYTQEESTTMQLVREGRLPDELLRSETMLTKRLVNEGLIPRGAVR